MTDTGASKFDRLAYLDALSDMLPDSVGILGPDLEFMEVNRAGLRLFGVTRFADLPKGAPLSRIVKGDREHYRENALAVLAGDADAAGRALRVGLLSADGKSHLMECRMAPLKNGRGDIAAVVVTAQDISQRQQAIDEAERSNAILQSILAAIPDAMTVVDEQGQIILFSKTAEEMFGYSQSEILGQSISLLMPESDRMSDEADVKRFLETGVERIAGKHTKHELRRKDGTIFPVQGSIGVVRAAGQRLFTGFYIDMTEKQRTEAELQSLQLELQHASRLSDVGTLASSLAHELNQPLTAIANYLSAGRDMLDDIAPENADMLREALNESVTEALRAGNIVRRLREFVSKGEIKMEVLSMAELINDSTILGLIDARVKGVEYDFDINPDINHVLADRVQIQQVMVNLIRNAIEAMEDSPVKKLAISAHTAPDNRVEFVVRDTGPGISKEVRSRLFEPFSSTKPDGMGLGLSICKTIVEAHGAELNVEAAPEGGAVFKFALRKAPKDERAAE